MKPDARKIQSDYYTATAHDYDELHCNERDEHALALHILQGCLDFFDINSVLDVGAGTGRALLFLQKTKPNLEILGVEPVQALREVGHANGIAKDRLVDGDALSLEFPDNAFDLVSEFGVLHHVEDPGTAVAEMLRVAKKAIFISDSNNFGQGRFFARSLKQAINLFGLWKITDLIKTRGKGYIISEGDGLSYSYSVFNNYAYIKERCEAVYLMGTDTKAGINPYKTSGNIALLGIKRGAFKKA